VTRSDPSKLVLDWPDGARSEWSAAELRGACPCAHCVDELSGVRRHDPASVPAELTQQDVRLVGNYALAVRFSDGHQTGIFPWAFLRERSPRTIPGRGTERA
jgi:DUF971 family protein